MQTSRRRAGIALLVEHMLGLAAGDVDMIRNFGTVIDDDAVRSLVLSTRLLGSREMMIINHTDCGMLRFTDSEFEDRLRKETGRAPIARQVLQLYRHRGEHPRADSEGQVSSMDLAGRSSQGIRF